MYYTFVTLAIENPYLDDKFFKVHKSIDDLRKLITDLNLCVDSKVEVKQMTTLEEAKEFGRRTK